MKPSVPRDNQTKRTTTPRYREIAAVLLQDIQEGRYPLGSLLPTEAELCELFATSRNTMREALRVILEKGLIQRRAGAGSVVIASSPHNMFTHRVGTIEQWLRYPTTTFRKTVASEEVAADQRLAALLKCELGQRWFRIDSLRYDDESDRPLNWTEIYVLPKYADVIKRRDHARTSVHLQIEKMFGEAVEYAQMDIFASNIPARIAKELQVEAGSSCLTVVRRYTGMRSGMFEVTVTTHPGDRYTYSMELRREQSAK
ncbi:MAG TPA: GntR family transcriptional regulator [Pseudorhodoferax sp.]|jgi:DNA-binding GntR family transcriptional regulator|nr:GntR family transcriptional regulator [Pseudorhodoferax sp.]